MKKPNKHCRFAEGGKEMLQNGRDILFLSGLRLGMFFSIVCAFVLFFVCLFVCLFFPPLLLVIFFLT